MLSYYCKFYALKYHLMSVISILKYKELPTLKSIGIQCDTRISGISLVHSSFTHAILYVQRKLRPQRFRNERPNITKTITRSITATGR